MNLSTIQNPQARLVCALVALFLLAFAAPNAAFAQEDAMPEVEQYRKRYDFNDPYAVAPPKPVIIQTEEVVQPEAPEAEVVVPARVEKLMELYKETKEDNFTGQGYRVQIYSGNSEGAEKARFRFMSSHSAVEVYTRYESPVFKVRVGNFRGEEDAQNFCNSIKQEFPSAFIVPETIEVGD